MHTIRTAAEHVYRPLLARKTAADRIQHALSVLHKFQFLFALPGVLLQATQANQYEKAIRAYKRAKAIVVRDVPLLQRVHSGTAAACECDCVYFSLIMSTHTRSTVIVIVLWSFAFRLPCVPNTNHLHRHHHLSLTLPPLLQRCTPLWPHFEPRCCNAWMCRRRPAAAAGTTSACV